MATTPLEDQIRASAPELVNRARQGDQNAMAMIVQVGESAKKGSPRARIAYDALKRYIQAHPVSNAPTMAGPPARHKRPIRYLPATAFGADVLSALETINPATPNRVEDLPLALVTLPKGGPAAVNSGAILLANGPALSTRRISAMGRGIPSKAARRQFYLCIHFCGSEADKLIDESPPGKKPLGLAGQCVGYALKIQLVRLANSSIGQFDSMAGWELGEAAPRLLSKVGDEAEETERAEDGEEQEYDSDRENQGGDDGDNRSSDNRDSGGGGGGGSSSGGNQSASPQSSGGSPDDWRARRDEWLRRQQAAQASAPVAPPVSPVASPVAPVTSVAPLALTPALAATRYQAAIAPMRSVAPPPRPAFRPAPSRIAIARPAAAMRRR